MSMLVKDGQLELDALAETRITKQELYAMLRKEKINNLSKVKRAYFEACGILNVFEEKESKPGLPIVPQCDSGVITDILELADHGMMACTNCGYVQAVAAKNAACEVCGDSDWIAAYLEPQKEEA